MYEKKNRDKKYNLQKKMRKTFITVFVSVLLITMTITLTVVSVIYSKNSYQLCEQLVDVNIDLVEKTIMDVQKFQKIIVSNDTVKEVVSYYKNKDKHNYLLELEYYRKLSAIFNLLIQSDSVKGAYIIKKDGECIYTYGSSLKKDYNMFNEEWFCSVENDILMNISYASNSHETNYLVNPAEGKRISIIMPIQLSSNIRFSVDAFLICDLEVSDLINESGGEQNIPIAILDGTGELYTAKSSYLNPEEKKEITQKVKFEDEYTGMLDKKIVNNNVIVSRKTKIFGWKVIGIKRMEELKSINITIGLLMLGIVWTSIYLILILSKRISKSILLPMECLVKECNQVAAGDYTVQFKEKKSEEISFLSDTIEEMVHNIVSLSNRVIEEEKQLSDEKVKVLQHQINPHFLNNVLQTIKALAIEKETEKISKISTLLGHILAYSVYEPYKNIELKTELSYLSSYITLQNIRYNNKIMYAINCDAEIEDLMIPKLMLQPVVENSIEHGYDGKNNLMLNISTEKENDTIFIMISDNGQGIEEKELEELRNKLFDGQVYNEKGSIGIMNVSQRLKKFYGENSKIEVFSKIGLGTTVIIQIQS